jgi:ribosome-associated toxin RatA of RatAB toxin-antitoxin module
MRFLFLIFISFIGLNLVNISSYAQKIPYEKKLRQSNVHIKTVKVPGSDMKELQAYAIIKAPAAKLWAIISKCADYHKTMPSIDKSKQISVKNGVIRCEIQVDLPFPFDDLRSVTDAKHKEKPGEFYQRSWSLVEGDYTINRGSWRLQAIDGGKHTYIRYIVHVEPKTSIPDFIKSMAQKSKIPDMFEHLREKVGAAENE